MTLNAASTLDYNIVSARPILKHGTIVAQEHVFAMLTPRTTRLLLGQGLTTVQQVTEQYPLGLLSIHGFGYKSLREVERCFSLGHYNPPRPGRQ